MLIVALMVAVLAPAGTGSAQASCSPSDFIDRDDIRAVHRGSVDCAVAEGITTGFPDETFRPAAQVRRDHMAAFIARTLDALGVDLPDAGPQGFDDTADNTHARDIDRLAAAGIVHGSAPGRFAPAQEVTRDQVASFLLRASAYVQGVEVTDLQGGGSPFTDIAGSVHRPNIEGAYAHGLVRGRSEDRYEPHGRTRRDQMASFVMNAYHNIPVDDPDQGEPEQPPPPPPSCASPAPLDAWCALYWDNRDLGGPPAAGAQVPTASREYGQGGPGHGIGADNFSALFVRRWPFQRGRYEFYTRADDRVRILIDNDVKVGWNSHAGQERRTTVDLTEGTKTVRVEFKEFTGAANLLVDWRRVGDIPPSTSRYAAPLANRVVTQSFNCFNCIGTGQYHTGTDYDGDTQIRAVADGRVVLVVRNGQNDHGFGNTVILRHTNGDGSRTFSMYSHLASITPQEGACVRRGGRIGVMGGSGYGSPDYWPRHLHFEMKTGAVLTNPSGPGTHFGYTPTPAQNYGYRPFSDYLGTRSARNICQ